MAASRFVIFRPDPRPETPMVPRGWVVVREAWNATEKNHVMNPDVREPNDIPEEDWQSFQEFPADVPLPQVQEFMQSEHPGHDVFIPQSKYWQGMSEEEDVKAVHEGGLPAPEEVS